MSSSSKGDDHLRANDLVVLRSPWANIQRNVRLTHAKVKRSQRLIRQSLHLLQASASHVRPLVGDPGWQAAALGPSLARAYMRRPIRSGPPGETEDSEVAEVAETADGSA